MCVDVELALKGLMHTVVCICSLFCPSQVSVLQDDGFLAEYVHVLAHSALVVPGDKVEAGEVLCKSGDAGFCPSPHLHLQLQHGEGDDVPTVLFALLDCEGNPYFPVAGKWYGPEGEVALPVLTQKQEECRRGALEARGDDNGAESTCLEGSAGCKGELVESAPRLKTATSSIDDFPPPAR